MNRFLDINIPMKNHIVKRNSSFIIVWKCIMVLLFVIYTWTRCFLIIWRPIKNKHLLGFKALYDKTNIDTPRKIDSIIFVNAIYLCYLCLLAYSDGQHVLTTWVTCPTRGRECLPSRAPAFALGFWWGPSL